MTCRNLYDIAVYVIRCCQFTQILAAKLYRLKKGTTIFKVNTYDITQNLNVKYDFHLELRTWLENILYFIQNNI